MKKLTFLLFGLLVLAINVSWAQVTLPHYEGFDYTASEALQTQTGWTAMNTGDDIVVVSGNLTFEGLQASTGNKISFAGTGIDAAKSFTSQSAGTVYYSFIMKVTGLGSLNETGGYFTGFSQNTSTFGATVWTGLDGTGYKIGINPRTSTTTNMVWATGTHAIDEVVFVVVSYTFNANAGDDVVNIWVNPSASSFGGATPPAVTATATNATGTDLTSIVYFFLRQDSNTETPSVEMDECRVGLSWADVTPAATDVTSPVLTYTPLNNATNVPISTNITIAFDEAVQNIDNSEITNANVASLLTLKLNDAAGVDVPFTATIDAAKQLITIDPTSDLLNNQVYYLAVAPVEDAAGNATAGSNITFTTIAATTPSLTLTYPVGGETFDAGDTVTITWTSANMGTDNIKIEAQVFDGSTWGWISLDTVANSGTLDLAIPANALYGTQYRIRITGITNTSATDESNDFTIIEIANNIAALRAKFTATNYAATNVYKLTGEAVVSYYKTGTKENIYIEDNTAAIVVYDNLNTVNTVYNIGDGITGIYGNIPALYHGLLEFIPIVDPGVTSSTGNTITPEVVTPFQVTTSPNDYQAEKLKLNHVIFLETGVFAASTNYTISDGTNTIVFRPISAMIGQSIPTGLINLTAICGYYDAPQLFSLEMTDFVDAQDNTSIANEDGLTQAAGDSITAGSTTPVEVLRFKIVDIANDGLPTNVTTFTIKAGTGNTADWTTDINEGFFKDELGNNIAFDSVDLFSDHVVVYVQTNGLIVPEGDSNTIVLTITTESTTANGVVFQAQVGGTGHGFTADIFGSQFAADFTVVDGNARTVQNVGIVEQNSNSVQIYPNPSQSWVYIAGANNSNVIVRDITGKQIINTTITSDNYQLDISAFEQGMYFVQIENTVYKLIVK